MNKELIRLKEERNNLTKDLATLKQRKEEVYNAINDDSSEEDLDKAETETKDLDSQINELNGQVETLDEEITDLEKEIENVQEDIKKPNGEGEKRSMDKELLVEQRSAMNDFLRSGGKEIRNTVKSTDVGVIIPEEIVYNPELEVSTITDLSTLVTKTKVNSASGKYPILKRATAGLATVAELEENPALAKPEFLEVAWAVETYRGAIPLSQEAIEDSAVDLVALVARNAQEQKINTLNTRIANVLKTFAAKTISDTDGLKAIFNVDLDPAYNSVIVASQSFFQALDTMKDKNGRYLLQDDVTSPSGKRVFGKHVHVVNDTLLGAAGEAKAFVGDLKRGVLFADRKDIALDWIKSEIYGKYLAVVLRIDVKKADGAAGYFVTYTAPTNEGA